VGDVLPALNKISAVIKAHLISFTKDKEKLSLIHCFHHQPNQPFPWVQGASKWPEIKPNLTSTYTINRWVDFYRSSSRLEFASRLSS
jgi:hypothetical protein